MPAAKYVMKNWSTILLIFVPLGISAPRFGCSGSVVFVLNCLAIIPLADILCRATDDVSAFLGETAGALLNVTMGNATEVVILYFVLRFHTSQQLTNISVHALLQRQFLIVRTSLLGSIIVNILLVLSLAIITGEAHQRGQTYNILATRMAVGLLCLTTISLLAPSALRILSETSEMSDDVLTLSRAISIVLIIVYGIYLFSQIRSTKYAYRPLIQLDPEEHNQPEVVQIEDISQTSFHRRTLSYRRYSTTSAALDDLSSQLISKEGFQSVILRISTSIEIMKAIPWIRKTFPVVALIISTSLIAISGGYLVDTIDHFVDHSPVSKTMIGLIILPVVGNAAELVSGIMFASRKQMDLAFAISIGSAIQIALFVTPLMVIAGWGMGRDMALHFTVFEALTLTTSTVLFAGIALDERCSLLKGVGLFAGYTVVT